MTPLVCALYLSVSVCFPTSQCPCIWQGKGGRIYYLRWDVDLVCGFCQDLINKKTENLATLTGPNFIHPHPPTPKNTLLGVGGVWKRGGYKISPAGGPQNIHPHPPPLKNALWPEMGEGGGAKIISPCNSGGWEVGFQSPWRQQQMTL